MRVVTFMFSAAAVQTWTVDRDTTIVGGNARNGVVFSNDPSLTAALIITPTATVLRDDFVLFFAMGGGSAYSVMPLKIPIQGGSKIFVSANSVCSAQLFLDDDLS